MKKINLALQGGGAHGAFTWGALDRLLDEEDIEVEAISATSAGAMNATAFKAGWISGGRDGAKQALADFWLRLAGIDGHVAEVMADWLRLVAPSPAILSRMLEFSPTALATEGVTRAFSPYQLNPTGYHPLRSVVDEMMAVGDVCKDTGPKLLIAATNVRTGRVRVFSGEEVTTDAVLASACLPTVFQAIEIDDPKTGRREAYWDGGYMGNPALFPLFYRSSCRDILIVHINPIVREDLPFTSTEILNRINEISFNSSLMKELRAIDLVNRLIEEGVLPKGRMTENRLHSVADDDFMTQLGVASKTTPARALMVQLKDAGHAAMDRFLIAHKGDIGKRSSMNMRALFDGPATLDPR
ncbi:MULTISPECIES: patatin-like phospholipase family protein [unclassified Meridianimarinicoccus]|uniref:patatin-like phospholipase family protein n=1 Tax=unclassified Meridianimarinicoccus TaxID=2923344 RepID=UPI001865F9EA|nr:patatin-like phospholipase family protein [Fluviibacterium sp. MJW13]